MCVLNVAAMSEANCHPFLNIQRLTVDVYTCKKYGKQQYFGYVSSVENYLM